MKPKKEFVIGKLYRYKNNHLEVGWRFHSDDEEYQLEYPSVIINKEVFVVLDIKQSVVYKRLLSVKVLGKDGIPGRLYMHPEDWELIDSPPQA